MDIFIINSPLKCKAGKAFKKFLRNKLKIKAVKPLTFLKGNSKSTKVISFGTDSSSLVLIVEASIKSL